VEANTKDRVKVAFWGGVAIILLLSAAFVAFE
jgi:hypothetical protein